MSIRVEISAGIVSAAFIEGEGGLTGCPADIGSWSFFVELVEGDYRDCLWSGSSYEDAIKIAEELRLDSRIRAAVRDNVTGVIHD